MRLEPFLARWLPTYVLILARCSGVVALGPVFGTRTLPATLKAALAGLLSLLLTPVVGPQGDLLSRGAVALAASLLGELAIGAVLGLAVRLSFAGVGMAGEMAAVQMGVGLPGALDPQTMAQVSSVSNLLDQIAILIFLAVDGHHTLLAALAQSLVLAPPLSFGYQASIVQLLLGLFGAALLLAIRLAAPAGAALLATMVVLGLLNRVAPQVNVFMLSFALMIGVGLLVLLAALPVMGAVMAASFRELPGTLAGLLLRLRHGL
jgi:flagellar biosynthetic protein FliR